MENQFWLIIYLLLLTPLFWIDIKTYLLPLPLTSALLVVGITKASLLGHVTDSLLGLGISGMTYGSIYGIGRLIYKRDVLGKGDILLGMGIGLFWGATHAGLTVYFSFIIGAIWGIVILAKDRLNTHLNQQKRESAEKKTTSNQLNPRIMPFGPSIILASALILWLQFSGMETVFLTYLGISDYPNTQSTISRRVVSNETPNNVTAFRLPW